MASEIIEIIGSNSNLVSVVLVGVHGNEKCGVSALENILPNLKINQGKVFFIYANPKAITQNVRYTEANLNRMFKSDDLISESDRQSYEYERAQYLKKYLNQADALLDVHASFTPTSQRFVICENNARGIIEYLPVNLIVSGFDKIEPGGTDYYMNNRGKIGICVECGYLDDPTSTEVAENSIINFLKARGHLDNDLPVSIQEHIRMNTLYFSQTDYFTLNQDFADFARLTTGELIGYDGEQEIRAEKDCFILFSRQTTKTGEEAFLLGEKE